jgi:F-type H+-transporting ATPase subunit delta
MMSELKTLARPYAVAAYQFARQHHQVDTWLAMLANIRHLVLAEEPMQKILRAPSVDVATFLRMLQPFTKKSLDEHGLNFLKLLRVNHRLVLAPVIFELFEAIKSEAENIIHVDVITAITLNDVEQRALVEKMVKRLNHNVSPAFHVDEAIIAGAIIRVGDKYVLDGSVKTQLERLKTEF